MSKRALKHSANKQTRNPEPLCYYCLDPGSLLNYLSLTCYRKCSLVLKKWVVRDSLWLCLSHNTSLWTVPAHMSYSNAICSHSPCWQKCFWYFSQPELDADDTWSDISIDSNIESFYERDGSRSIEGHASRLNGCGRDDEYKCGISNCGCRGTPAMGDWNNEFTYRVTPFPQKLWPPI